MSNEKIKYFEDPVLKKENGNIEDFSMIHEVVMELISSIGKKKEKINRKPRSTKKWKKKKKSNTHEELGIRELPFTF